MKKIRWKRILLKLSGEVMSGEGKTGLDVEKIEYIAREIESVISLGCEVAIVIGGGNMIRGKELAAIGIDRTTADYMGMLGTIINSLALQNVLEQRGLMTRVLSSLDIVQVAETFIRRRAVRHLEKGRIVIFAGGTGNPYFSTDTTATLRASEVCAEVILKATKVAGIYDSDPKLDAAARLLDEITHRDLVSRDLKVMDLTAATLAMENHIPLIVFDVFTKGNLKKLVLGEKIGSEIK